LIDEKMVEKSNEENVGSRWKDKKCNSDKMAGLPDFSRHNVPKRGKIYQITTNLPNDDKLYRMTITYSKWD
jgi:hypothetical protein